jgi:predicted ATPase
MLTIQQGDARPGLAILRPALDELRAANFRTRHGVFCGPLALSLAQMGQVDEGLTAIAEGLENAERAEERWYVPELLRVRGVLMLLDGAAGSMERAEHNFHQSLTLAHQRGALSWELRAAMSLARLLRDQGRSAEALALLQPVYDRFTEGFDTADLKAAKALLDALQ